jgi:hypothetical protein
MNVRSASGGNLTLFIDNGATIASKLLTESDSMTVTQVARLGDIAHNNALLNVASSQPSSANGLDALAPKDPTLQSDLAKLAKDDGDLRFLNSLGTAKSATTAAKRQFQAESISSLNSSVADLKTLNSTVADLKSTYDDFAERLSVPLPIGTALARLESVLAIVQNLEYSIPSQTNSDVGSELQNAEARITVAMDFTNQIFQDTQQSISQLPQQAPSIPEPILGLPYGAIDQNFASTLSQISQSVDDMLQLLASLKTTLQTA